MYVYHTFQLFNLMLAFKTPCLKEVYGFGKVEKRNVVADFSGGEITSDAGLLLISTVDRTVRLSQQIAGCFEDHRDPTRIEHKVGDLIAQRIYGLIQGYSDLNDHDQLRHDPLFGVAVGKLESRHARSAALAGKSTMHRLEQAVNESKDPSAYQGLSVNPEQLRTLFVEFALDQHSIAPAMMILDMDVTDDEVHGHQEQSFYNTYYDSTCYAPLLIFWGRHLLAARLRPSNVDPAEGALEEIARIIPLIQQRWPQTLIMVRGDSAYARDDLMTWCEAHNVDYVFGLSKNERLLRITQDLVASVENDYRLRQQLAQDCFEKHLGKDIVNEAQLQPLVTPALWYRSVPYQTLDTWSKSRRVVCKLTYDHKGINRRFLVTSYTADAIRPGRLYCDQYCPRGEMENRIKEHQLDLFSDRTSAHRFEVNQLRLWFSSFAYTLMQALRDRGLFKTELATAQMGTIRKTLLKMGARVRISVRRVHIAFCSSSPFRALFDKVYQRLITATNTG
jgi:Transposase DDE domain group 1